jgi:hypothetical protein
VAEMKDYSGPLKEDFRFEDLSKEALIKLLYAYAKLYLLMYGEFTNLVTERKGKDEAWKYQMEAWMRMAPVAMRMVCKAMNIRPSGVESLLKALQLDPAFPPNYDAKYAGTGRMEIKDGRGIQYLDRCYALDGFEFLGEETVIQFCHGMEPPTFSAHARYHHPNMVCKPTKLPPREKTDKGPVCVWEYYIAEQDTK